MGQSFNSESQGLCTAKQQAHQTTRELILRTAASFHTPAIYVNIHTRPGSAGICSASYFLSKFPGCGLKKDRP